MQETLERFGKDKSIFETDKDFRNSICMSLLQIGELTGHLPVDFRNGAGGFAAGAEFQMGVLISK